MQCRKTISLEAPLSRKENEGKDGASTRNEEERKWERSEETPYTCNNYPLTQRSREKRFSLLI